MRKIITIKTFVKVTRVFSFLIFYFLASSAFALSKPTFPAIFIHGIASSADDAWGPFKDFLVNQGWIFGGSPTFDTTTLGVTGINGPADFYTMNFSDANVPDFRGQNLTLERQGMELDAVITAVLAANPDETKVLLVGHSMGGLAARNYLQGLARRGSLPIPYRDNVSKLITVGTPHSGTELAVMCQEFLSGNVCILLPNQINPNSEAVALLRPDSDALLTLNNLPANPLPLDVLYTSIQGTGTPVILFGGDGDGIVSTFSQNLGNIAGAGNLTHESIPTFIVDRSGCDPGFNNPLIPNQTHTCETSDQGVWAVFLQQIPKFSVNWIGMPANSATSGDSFTISWEIVGGRTFGHTNVHFDTIQDLSPGTCLLRSSCQTTPFQQGANATFTATITAPNLSSQTTYYFAVHGEIDGFDGFSEVIPVVISPSATQHTLTINSGPSGNPNPVSSGGSVNLNVSATDSLGHSLTYAWTSSCPAVLGSNGSFGGGSILNPTWTAPANSTGSLQNCMIQVTVSDGLGLSQVRTYQQGVNFSSPAHNLTITSGPSGNPNPVIPGGTANLAVTATDSLGHTLSYSWTASCPTLPSNGTLIGTTNPSPSWIAPQNSTGSLQNCTMQVTVTDGLGLSETRSYVQGVSPGGVASLAISDGIRLIEPPPYQLSQNATVDATIKNIGSATVLIDRFQAVGTFRDGFGFTFERTWPPVSFINSGAPLSLGPGSTYRYTQLLTDGFPGLATIGTVVMQVKFNNIPGSQSITNFISPGTAQLVFEVGHTINITNGPNGNPNPVASGGSVNVTVNTSDTLGHSINHAWSASCPNLSSNGVFNNSSVQQPTWTAPVNTTGSQQNCTVQLIVNDGQGLSKTVSFNQGVASEPHNINILSGPGGSPNPVGSGGAVNVTVSASDSLNHSLSYSWISLCSTLSSNGSFSNASVQAPTWTAPTNLSGSQQNCTIQVTVSDNQITPQVRSYSQGVSSREHAITITSAPSGNPNPIGSGGVVNVSATATDSLGHNVTYAWTASCPAGLGSNGSFSNANVQAPTWTAPANSTGSQQNCTLQVVISDGQGLSENAQYLQAVSSVANPVPSISSLSPNNATAGGPGFTLIVNGSNFVASSVIRWNGQNQTTTFNSSAQLQASIPASLIVNAGSAELRVFNPTPGGGVSNPLTFTINAPPADATPPDTSITSGPTGTITVNNATFNWTGSDNVTPVANLLYAYRLDPIEPSFSAFGSATTKSYSNLANGNYTIFVKAKDQAGNEDSTPDSRTFTVNVDTTAPLAGPVTPSNTQFGSFVDSPFDLNTAFTDNESPVTGCEYTTNGGSTWLQAQVLGSLPNFTCRKVGITGSNGQVLNLNMRATSGGGTSQGTAVQVRVDSAAPSGSVNINSGVAFTKSTAVQLTLTASDTSGLSQMCISNTNSACSTWETYAKSKNWNLPPGDGIKTVYVWFKDRVGNANSSPFSDQITLDTVPPTNPTTVTSPSHTLSVWSKDRTVDMKWSGATDERSGVYGYSIKWDTIANSLPDTTSDTTATSKTSPSLPDGTNHYFHIRTRDKAENWNSSAVHRGPFFIDGTVPVNGTLNATAGNGQVSLSWSGFSDAMSGLATTDTYKLVFSTSSYPNSKCTNGITIYWNTGTKFEHKNLTNGTTYYYRLCAFDKAGNVSTGATRSATP